MRIIIIGCGKVGSALAELLDREGHEITIIDNRASAINTITETLDVMGVVGNGASYNVLISAGIEEADLLISVTGSDELNLLCCIIAKKAGNCHTIARVRNPEYHKEVEFIREEMGLSMIINPELETASDIARLIRLPSAIDIETFAKGKVELLHLQIPTDSTLDQIRIKDIPSKIHCNILVCAILRNGQVFIPSGDSILESGDNISIVATPKNALEFFRKVGITSQSTKNVMIVGGSNISVYLARKLIEVGIRVKIVEQVQERCEQLSEMLPEALIIHANASDQNVLLEEEIENMDAFISLTNLDEENILLSLYAQKNSKAKVFTKITRLTFDEVIEDMSLGKIIKPKLITADRIVQYIRVMQNPKGSNVETLYKIINDKAEALEFRVKSNSRLVGVPLSKLKIRDHVLLCCINRKNKIIIPDGQATLQIGDTAIIVTTISGLNDLNDILQ